MTRRAFWLQAVLVLTIGGFYFWTAVPEWRPGLIAGHDDGYYNHLARGFLGGHLYLDVAADPYLATLANPWDPAQRGDRAIADTSYFRGRYYIYFGVSPEVLLFLPFRLLTGKFINDALAAPLFACVGWIASAYLLLDLRRRYFQRASEGLVAACLVALGLADMMPVLLRRPSFWEIPITCGYACCMVALAAIFRSLHVRRTALWLAVASAAFGFAVGSRPLYLLACPAVLLPLWFDARTRGLGMAWWRDRGWRRLALAAMAPLVTIGLGLALYNYLRFGDPTEFGLRYQIWNFDPAKAVYFSWHYLAYNLHAYWLAPAGWSQYFPFVTLARLPAAPPGYYGAEDPYGILPNMPFALLALGVFALATRGSPESVGRLRLFSAGVALTAAAMALPLLFLMAALNRYMVDFTPTIMLLACLGAFSVSARPWFHGAFAALGTLVACALAGYSAAFNVLASMRHDELFRVQHPALYRQVAHRWNWLSYEYDQWRKTEYGPIELKVLFPADRSGGLEPLVVTGRSFLSDYLFVQYVGPDTVEFGLEHTSRGTLLGHPVRAGPGQVHTIRIDLGSLYPPADHPYFDSMSPAEARLRQNTVRVTLDGQVAFDRALAVYEAAGPEPNLGSSGDRPGFPQSFSGRILSWRRLPNATVEPPKDRYGALRLELTLPAFNGPRTEPLISTGEEGRGDLISIHYESADRISFGYDHAGSDPYPGPELAVEPAAVQVIAIDSGALRPESLNGPGSANADRARRGRLVIRLNGRTAFAMPAPYYACDPDTVSVGFNAIRAVTASAVFTGNIRSVRRVAEPTLEPRSGAFRLELRFPPFSGVHNEPLVCAGETGRGDMVYVRYESPDRVSFGYDHWSLGGPMSFSCPFDPRAVQVIEIDFGALHPAASHEAPFDSGLNLRAGLLVRFNGRAMLEKSAAYYLCDPATVAVGLNPIQTSTASAAFTGEVVKAERISEPAP
jgi:hypothetical protein